MKIFAPVIICTTLMLTACGNESPQSSAEEIKDTASQAVLTHNYQCESGNTIAVTYPATDSTIVEYLATQHKMNVAVSASGARYTGDKYEWWTKGSGAGSSGMLFHHQPDGSTGDTIETCTAI
ncbi:MliC family protein [Pseudoalteromonas sp.]|uniref:MliC family protein n=1 Tax=Pseudoalteromonas sp. TaxID=53249 RepID=UPI00356A84D7